MATEPNSTEPDSTDPTEPDSTDPTEPDSTDPTEPDSTDPTEPDPEHGGFVTGTGLTVDMLLCDSAQVAGGKLFILGGGLATIGPKPQPLAIALQITVPWDQANVRHDWRIDLIDEDGHPMLAKDKPVVIRGRFEAGRPAGLQPGTPLGVSLAINLTPLPVVGGRGYAFVLTINDESRPDWRVRFFARPSPQTDRRAQS